MDAALQLQAGDWRKTHAPAPAEIEPLSPAELRDLLRGGEVEADLCERGLVTAARAQAAVDLAIGEGLHALRLGDRLPRLGCHLDDYAREVLGIGKRTALNLARLGRELRTRPVLRAALREGRVRIRAAETILPVASPTRRRRGSSARCDAPSGSSRPRCAWREAAATTRTRTGSRCARSCRPMTARSSTRRSSSRAS